jgi:hypothetical protein
MKGGEILRSVDSNSANQLSTERTRKNKNKKTKGDSFMSSFRKSLSVVLAIVMVLSLMAPVLAATPTDVTGTAYQDSVTKLSALGVLNGYPDGTFKPDSNITRAEFAKVADYMLGMGAAADLSKGQTKFKDVGASHWASGLINVATEKGLLKGYPDGTFKPEANVSYAEAITILVRALGMGPVVEGKGSWPANYLSQASSVGITKDVSGLDGNAQAIRGSIAQLAWNTLTAEKWGAKDYSSTGITYGPLGKALLEDQFSNYTYKNIDGKFVSKSFDNVTVVGTQLAGGLNKDKITLKLDDQASLKAMLGATVNTADVQVTDTSVDLNSLYGKKVNLLFGKDNKIASISVNTADIVAGTVDKNGYNTTDNKITVNGKDYSFKSDAIMYLNTKSYSFSAANFAAIASAVGNSAAKVTLVLDSGRIQSMNMFVADAITVPGGGVTMKQFVVKEIKSTSDVTNVAASPSSQFKLNDATADANKYVIVKNGKVATAADIKAGDALTYIYNTTSNVYYLVASDNKVTGTISNIAEDSLASNSSVRKILSVGGKDYPMTVDGSVYMTKTGNVDNVVAIDTTAKDFYNQSATLTLNANGQIILVSGAVKSSASMQTGIVSKAIWDGIPASDGTTDKYIQILTPNGQKLSYKVKGDKYKQMSANGALSTAADVKVAAGAIAAGSIVVYDVSVDGTINANRLFDTKGYSISDSQQLVYVDTVTTPTTIRINNNNKKITVGATSYYASASTTYLNQNTFSIEGISGWSNLVSADKTTDGNDINNLLDNGNFYIVRDQNNMITSIIVNYNADITNGGVAYLGSTAQYGIYVGTQNQSSDDFVTLFVNGKQVTYTVANGVYSPAEAGAGTHPEKGDLVKFQLNGDGKFDGGSSLAARQGNFRADISAIAKNQSDSDKIKTFDKTNRLMTITAAATRDGQANVTTLKLASDAVIYDMRAGGMKIGTMDDLAAGQYVYVDSYKVADDNYQIVVIVQ